MRYFWARSVARTIWSAVSSSSPKAARCADEMVKLDITHIHAHRSCARSLHRRAHMLKQKVRTGTRAGAKPEPSRRLPLLHPRREGQVSTTRGPVRGEAPGADDTWCTHAAHSRQRRECDFLAIESKVSVSTVAINVKRPAEVFQEGHGPSLALPESRPRRRPRPKHWVSAGASTAPADRCVASRRA